MKAFIVLAVLGAVFGAPTDNEEVQLWKDTKAPVLLETTGDNERKQREVEEKHNDHMRSYYDVPHGPALVAPSAIVSAASAALAPAAIAPASPVLGVFPGAKVGGCAIPLLLSCAPNVHSGHLAQSSYAAPAYRADADHKLRASEQWARSEASQMLFPAELQQHGFQNIDTQQTQWMETEGAKEAEMNPHHHHHHHLVALDIHQKNHHHQL